MFDAVKKNSKYKDVQFQAVDLDDHDPLAEKYGVRSIPYVVMVSGSGTVLYSDNPPMERSDFEELVNRFH